jgi:hypothetical protein
MDWPLGETTLPDMSHWAPWSSFASTPALLARRCPKERCARPCLLQQPAIPPRSVRHCSSDAQPLQRRGRGPQPRRCDLVCRARASSGHIGSAGDSERVVAALEAATLRHSGARHVHRRAGSDSSVRRRRPISSARLHDTGSRTQRTTRKTRASVTHARFSRSSARACAPCSRSAPAPPASSTAAARSPCGSLSA